MKGSVIHKQGICEVHHFVKSYVEKQLKNSIFQCMIAGNVHVLQFIISEDSKDSENLEKYMHIRTKAKKKNTTQLVAASTNARSEFTIQSGSHTSATSRNVANCGSGRGKDCYQC